MRTITWTVAVAALAACSPGGTSTDEAREAAIERARAELGLPADAPLEARVWVGGEHEGEPVLCGTVSDTAAGPGARAKRFAARPDPIEWLVFEDAHAPSLPSQPDKFVEWETVCSRAQQS